MSDNTWENAWTKRQTEITETTMCKMVKKILENTCNEEATNAAEFVGISSAENGPSGQVTLVSHTAM